MAIPTAKRNDFIFTPGVFCSSVTRIKELKLTAEIGFFVRGASPVLARWKRQGPRLRQALDYLVPTEGIEPSTF